MFHEKVAGDTQYFFFPLFPSMSRFTFHSASVTLEFASRTRTAFEDLFKTPSRPCFHRFAERASAGRHSSKEIRERNISVYF